MSKWYFIRFAIGIVLTCASTYVLVATLFHSFTNSGRKDARNSDLLGPAFKKHPDYCQKTPASKKFQMIINETAFAYSAYIDDRSPSNYTNPEEVPVTLRVFVYFRRGLQPTVDWKCVLWYPDHRRDGLITSLYSVSDVMQNTRWCIYRFRAAQAMCALPQNKAKVKSWFTKPCAVSLVMTDWEHGVRPTNILPIVDLRDTRKQYMTAPHVNFTLCISPLHFPNYDWTDIVKFVEIHRVLGVEKFIFFVSISTREDLRQCLQQYAKEQIYFKSEKQKSTSSLVEINAWDPPINGAKDINTYGQDLAINDCIYRTMYRTRYLAIYDLDEMIVPQRANSWSEMIQTIPTGATNPEDVTWYRFRNVFFPTNKPIAVDDEVYSEHPLAVKYNINALLKTRCDPNTYPPEYRSKVMMRPELVLQTAVHSVSRLMSNKQHTNILASQQDGLLFHYRNISGIKVNITDSNINVNRRLHHFADDILDRVNEAMERHRPANTKHL